MHQQLRALHRRRPNLLPSKQCVLHDGYRRQPGEILLPSKQVPQFRDDMLSLGEDYSRDALG